MANHTFSTNRNFFKFTIFTTLSLAVFCFNSVAQTDSKVKKSAFGTLASVNEKSATAEIARPRLVEDKSLESLKKEEVKSESADKTPTVQPNTVLVTSAAIINQLERQAFDILNGKRKENNLPPIEWSEDMAKVARLHSENMAKNKFFSHTGRDGTMVNDRADSLGFSRWKAIGENIAYNRGYDNPVEFACQRWMQSESHRENILNSRWKEAGVGVAITADGTYYFTQVFVLR